MAIVNPELSRRRNRDWKRKVRDQMIEYLGGTCSRCGFTDRRALQIDHIHGGGSKELAAFANNLAGYYAKIREHGSQKYQLLCANCNWIKRSENNEMTKRIHEPIVLDLWRNN